jgi:hypothetical protein
VRLNAAGAFAAGILTAVLVGGASSTILAQGSMGSGADTAGSHADCQVEMPMAGPMTDGDGMSGPGAMDGHHADHGMMHGDGTTGSHDMMGSQGMMGPDAGSEGMMGGQGTMTCQGAMTCVGTPNAQPMHSPSPGSDGMGGMGGPEASPTPTPTASEASGSGAHDSHHPSASPAA